MTTARAPRTCRRAAVGQVLAEFALVLPIFLVLIFGVIEAGRFIFHYEVLNNATREGVRYAIVHGQGSADPTGPSDDPTGADIKTAIETAAFGLVGVGDLVIPDPVYAGPNGASNKRGSNVTVSVQFTYVPLMPILPSITIKAESTGVINN